MLQLPPRYFCVGLFLVALSAGLVLFFCTPAGLGLTNDSAAYLGGARSILAGTGYSDIWLDSALEPITHYPPLLSLTLSGIGLTGLDPYRGARVLNILLFAANTGLIGLLGLRTTRSQLAGFFLALLFVTNTQLLRIHAHVLSEPLFLFFSLLSFLFFDLSIENRWLKVDLERRSLKTDYGLLITGFLTGLAFLTRYSGLALIATFLLSIFLLSPDWRSRFIKITQFLAGAIPPIAAWFVRNALVAETATNRTFQYHAIELKNLRVGLYNFADFLSPLDAGRDWLFKSRAVTWILLGIGVILLAWLVYQAYRLLRRQAAPQPILFITALYTFGYLGAVLFSMSFFDASTKFQPRILSPVYVSWMILFTVVLSALTTQDTKSTQGNLLNLVAQKNNLRGLVIILAVLVLGLSTFNFQQMVLDLREAGQGYASWQWRDSVIMAELKKLPFDVAIYTNSPPAVYLVTGRASRVIPSTLDPVDNRPRGDYEQNLEQMRADLLAGRAVLALFDTSNIEDALGVENLADFSAGLKVLEKTQGDVLYGKP